MTNQQYRERLQYHYDTIKQELDYAIDMQDYVEAAELASYLNDAEALLVYVGG